jgi:hypothetical protein
MAEESDGVAGNNPDKGTGQQLVDLALAYRRETTSLFLGQRTSERIPTTSAD